MGTRDVSQCFECGVVGEGEVDIDDGLFYCYACWLIYHAARARLRRDTTHVQPARNFQGVSCAPGSAQHEQSVQDVSFAHDLEAELIQVGGWDSSSDSEGGRAVEGSEEHFDESEHVGDLAEEERSTDGEDGFGEEVDETRENERQGCRSSEGSDFESENEGEGCCGPEESDFAAEESYGEGDPDAEEGYEEYEEDDPDAEEGYEGVWDEVQEALSAMEHEEFDDTTEADCARSQASRPSSAASSQASVRS